MKTEWIAGRNIRKKHVQINTNNIAAKLQRILDRLDKMDERIFNLEHCTQATIPKGKNGYLIILEFLNRIQMDYCISSFL